MSSSPRLLVLMVCLLLTVPAAAQKSEIQFRVLFKGKDIGRIVATEQRTDKEIIHDIQSKTDTKILAFSIHVESDMKTVKGGNMLIEGTAYRQTSRSAEDVHASTRRLSARRYERTRNGTKSYYTEDEITFCVSDLYFKEPKGLTRIYSNMWAEMVAVQYRGSGVYQLITPNKQNATYTYANGKLVKVESDTPVGSVIAERL